MKGLSLREVKATKRERCIWSIGQSIDWFLGSLRLRHSMRRCKLPVLRKERGTSLTAYVRAKSMFRCWQQILSRKSCSIGSAHIIKWLLIITVLSQSQDPRKHLLVNRTSGHEKDGIQLRGTGLIQEQNYMYSRQCWSWAHDKHHLYIFTISLTLSLSHTHTHTHTHIHSHANTRRRVTTHSPAHRNTLHYTSTHCITQQHTSTR